jgi:hypothetical protein
MKRGFSAGLMLLIATLLLVTLGFLPKSVESYTNAGVRVVSNSLFATTTMAKINESCGTVNGVRIQCESGLTCSDGNCKLTVGSFCKANEDCEKGSLCSTLSAGGKKMSICLRPQ